MTMRILQAAILLLCIVQACYARSVNGTQSLVILDKGVSKDDYSKFWKSLTDRQFQLKFKSAADDSPKLFKDEEITFDHLIMFAPKAKKYGGEITSQSLVQFIKQGGNLLFVGSSELSETNREFAREFDVDFDELDTFAIDHFNFDKADDGTHTRIVADQIADNKYILSDEVRNGAPVLYRGIAHSISKLPLLTPILTGSPTAYSYETKEGQAVDQEPLVVGSKVGLVTAMQARNNARVTFVGSQELFSNAYFDAKVTRASDGKSFGKSSNAAFARDITQWTFQERGVLRHANINHHLSNELHGRDLYRIKDNLTYTIDISKWNGERWAPFESDDVQLEFTMLDPHVRTTLDPIISSTDAATFATTFKIPDRHGVFTLRVNYKRPGLSYIETRTLVNIRPYNHNEYPRFITAAYPYYTGAASTIVTFVLFTAVYLFNKDTTVTNKAMEKKTK